jgi:polyisoprenoid-binding protein YceI
MKSFCKLILLALLVHAGENFAQVSWLIDKGHGHVGFSINYMMLGDYYGKFRNYNGKIYSKSTTDFTDAIFDMDIDIVINVERKISFFLC